jgi:YrbI family 3-deoxy-D-manno-octulosonate 8-phosphate phosphatase
MIKIVLLDIDGVLTDGKVTVDSDGNESKTIDFRDIDAIFEMKRQGLKVGLITGEKTPITLFFRDRFKPDFFHNGCKDKTAALKKILDETGSAPDEACYVGDGKHDIPIMKLVSFRGSPANAIPAVRKLSNILLKHNGGDGCVWELMEWILAHNKHGSS